MPKSLLDALGAEAWSVSAVMFDLNDMLDDEGRPVSERRADAVVRAGVEMDMRPCPYAGIRQGKWMNASALMQLSRHYDTVMGEMGTFRRQAGGATATWDDILAGVLDQLARPAIHLLQRRDARGPVPARVAVGHKLAAGFFGVMRNLHERIALGADLPVSVEAFLNLVEQTNALVGPAEVCAGSPPMIRNTCITLIEGGDRPAVALEANRLEMARCLGMQVQLGIFWELYDRSHVWELIRGETRQQLRPSNVFLVRKLERAVDDVPVAAPPQPDAQRLPAGLEAASRQRLADALRDAADALALAEDLQTAEQLLGQPGSAIAYAGAAAPFALKVASYLNAHRIFTDELCRLEHRLRALLGLTAPAPIRLGRTVSPLPLALPWYELVVGRRIGESGYLTGSSAGMRTRAT